MRHSVKNNLLLICCLLSALVATGCDSDLEDGIGEDDISNAENPTGEPNQPITVGQPIEQPAGPETPSGPEPTPTNPAQTNDFTLIVGSALSIVEGQDTVELPVALGRSDGYLGEVSLTAVGQSEADDANLSYQFTDTILGADEQSTTLRLSLAIGPQPILQQERNLQVTATDAAGESSTAQVTLQVTPTERPDIYLLIGQSNMIGISEDNAKLAGIGEPDQPVDTIRQLNVTFNDNDNFATASDFTDPEKSYNTGNPLTIAVDPLHTGLQSNGSKSGQRIGMGLSFAKSARQNSSADIFLVPAAWSDTGFCKRDTNSVPGIGWNATQKSTPELSGTLLHDRAIVRADITITETGGILRGILWHQGEADSDDLVCAQTYADNLAEMILSLRTNIMPDARGTEARGPDSDVPFIVGTMAMGGEQTPFSAAKSLVDGALRDLPNSVNQTNFVNNDDLVPPAFSCGGGSCIHFGAAALREMGDRYYQGLIAVFQ